MEPNMENPNPPYREGGDVRWLLGPQDCMPTILNELLEYSCLSSMRLPLFKAVDGVATQCIPGWAKYQQQEAHIPSMGIYSRDVSGTKPNHLAPIGETGGHTEIWMQKPTNVTNANIMKLIFGSDFLYNRIYIFRRHKLLPILMIWLHLVYGKMFFLARHLVLVVYEENFPS